MNSFLLLVLGGCIGAACASVISCVAWYRNCENINNEWADAYRDLSNYDLKKIKEISERDLKTIRSLQEQNARLFAENKKLKNREFWEVPASFEADSGDVIFGG